MIDQEGFRPNVGIVLTNNQKQVFWAKRIGQDAWQFPQGGIRDHETPRQALYRELREEIGLRKNDVEILACTKGWLRYRLPIPKVRSDESQTCVGQKQKWFLLVLKSTESHITLDHMSYPEFDQWRWVDYWYPVDHVVDFKKEVYAQALKELSESLCSKF